MSRAISAELFKLRTTRTSWGVLLGALGLVLVISLIAALAGDFSSADVAPGIDLLQISGLVQIFALVLGILIVATEFRHGTITPSLLAVPNRARLVAAKLVAAVLAGALLGLVAGALCAAIVLPLLSSRGIETGAESSEVVKIVLGNSAASALFAAIGVGLGALLRNQVGAIIGALGWLFVVQPLLTIIPGFDDVINKWFPSGAAGALAGMSGSSDAPDSLAQVPAGLVLTAYAAVFVAAGLALLRRRDVSA
jgi:ABC-2 type transport system permease protein